MAASRAELEKWLKTLPADAEIGIDEGGLTLEVVGDAETYFDLGGISEEEEGGDDLCDLCMSSGVSVDRTTTCGKTIGIECGCDEKTDASCGNPNCQECKAGEPE